LAIKFVNFGSDYDTLLKQFDNDVCSGVMLRHTAELIVLVRAEVQILVSMCSLPMDQQFDMSIRFLYNKRIQEGHLLIIFLFRGEPDTFCVIHDVEMLSQTVCAVGAPEAHLRAS